MKFGDVIRRSGRNLRQSKARTVLTALALGVGGFTLTLTLAASQGARDYAHRLISSNFDPSSLIVAKDSSIFSGGGAFANKPQPYSDSLVTFGGGNGSFNLETLSDNDVATLRALPGLDDVIVYNAAQAQYVSGPNAIKYTGGFQTYDPYVSHQLAAGQLNNRQPASGEVILPADYVSLLGYDSNALAIGQKLSMTLRSNGASNTEIKELKIVAVAAPALTLATATDANTLLLSSTDAADFYGFINAGTPYANKHVTVTAHVSDGTNNNKLQAAKQAIQNAGYVAQSAADTEQFLNQIINVLQIIILVFGVITLIASFFGVINTQYISVLERTREIGLMKALGMSRATVSRLFIIEATWIGFLGAMLGAAVAFVVGTLMNPWLSQKLDFGSDRLLVYEPVQIAALVMFLMIVTTLAGLLPARKAAKLDPIEALRTE